MKASFRGFTLIELLIVIAIIGILSAMVLVSLQAARTKGEGAKIQSQLTSMRSAMELYYAKFGNYGSASLTNRCATPALSPWDDATFGLPRLGDPANYPSTAALMCVTSGTAWAASAYVTVIGHYFCVDNSGTVRDVGTSNTINFSPRDVVC
jgi:general secretion pathway protein G